uniref:WAP domain-containing protein n=1 Tax=Meloidogyne hapla TaxID=6305 RepID=A0A1I8B1J5_MELHA
MLFILLLRIYLSQYLLPFIIIFIYFIVKDANATSAVPNICPSNQLYFGPCIGGECPPTCPVVCTCVGRRDCCTTLQNGTNGGGGSISSNLLTRLLLALLLSSPPSNIGGPRARLSLVLCRDLALNCALYTFYCAIPVYALCMRSNCKLIFIYSILLIKKGAATCGLCNDGGGLLGMPLLLSLLGFNGWDLYIFLKIVKSSLGLTGNIGNPIASRNADNPPPPPSPNAIRAGAPPIREESGDDENNETTAENNFNNISIQNSFPNFTPLSNNRRDSNNPTKNNNNNIQPLNFAIPPGLQILDHQKIREKLIQLGVIRGGFN